MEGVDMRVLGIVGSARKGGNTEIMVREALATAQKMGAQTDIFLMSEKNVAPCDGCGACKTTGVCGVKDDMQELYRQMEAADAILWGTPVYFHTMSAQMKIVMDRTIAFLNPPERRLKGKVAAAYVATRRVGAAATRSQLINFFVIHGMIPIRGAIGYGLDKGEVRQGVGGSNPSALVEVQNATVEMIEMVRRLTRP
jgi:multimeric flavodoxin WrbA